MDAATIISAVIAGLCTGAVTALGAWGAIRYEMGMFKADIAHLEKASDSLWLEIKECHNRISLCEARWVRQDGGE